MTSKLPSYTDFSESFSGFFQKLYICTFSKVAHELGKENAPVLHLSQLLGITLYLFLQGSFAFLGKIQKCSSPSFLDSSLTL